MNESRRAGWLLLAFALLGASAEAQPPPQGPARADAEPPEAPAAPPRACEGDELTNVLAEVAESTGKKFIVDPRVRACVRIVPAPQSPSYPELLTVLRIHGFTAVEIGGFVNVMPDALARHTPTRLVQRDDPSIPDDEWVTRIVTVNGSAPQLVPILRPMMPQAAHLAATGDSNKLIIVDTYANVRRMTEIVRALTQ